MGNPAQALVVADHALVRYAVRVLLNARGGVALAGEVGLDSAVVHAVSCEADVVVIDGGVNESRVLDPVRGLRQALPGARIILLTDPGSGLDLRDVLLMGVRGFVNLEETDRQLPEALDRVLSGNVYVAPELMERMVFQLAAGGSEAEMVGLSEREEQVLRLSGQGYRPRLIADALKLSPKTVHAHRENLKRKLQVDSTAALDQLAVRWVRGDVSLQATLA